MTRPGGDAALPFAALGRFVDGPLLLVTKAGVIRDASAAAARQLGAAGPGALRGRPLTAWAIGCAAELHAFLALCAGSLQPVAGALVLRADGGRAAAYVARGARCGGAPGEQTPMLLLGLQPRAAAAARFAALTARVEQRTEARLGRRRVEASRAALRAREEFIAVAHHELSAPMTALSLQLGLLQRAVARLPASAGRPLAAKVARALRQVDRLACLGVSLLDVSRARRQALRLATSPCALAPLVADAISRVRPQLGAARCRVRLAVAADIAVQGDTSSIDRIVTNVLVNAAKYAPGGMVSISARAAHGAVEVHFRDHGGGVAAADLARIFDKHVRVGSAPRDERGGLGLGLYICRQLAEAMGGSMRAISPRGAGLAIILELPAADGPPL